MAEKKGLSNKQNGTKKECLHDGHRDRVREKFLEDGLDGFLDHQILELLLFYAIPRKDTNETAHNLLNTFGSFSAVFDAPLDSITDCGLTKNAAVLIKMIPQICQKYIDDRYLNKNKLVDENTAAERLLCKFIGRDSEYVAVLLVDAKGKELYCDIINKGSVSTSEVYVRKIIKLALKFHATSAILSHNHPSGLAFPSDNDIRTTTIVKKALSAVGVKLIDHIIIADMDYYSLVNSDEYFKLFM